MSGGEQGQGEHHAGSGKAEQRSQELVRIADLGDLGVAGAMKDRGGDDEDGGIDEQGHRKRGGGVEVGKADRLCFARRRAWISACLHDR